MTQKEWDVAQANADADMDLQYQKNLADGSIGNGLAAEFMKTLVPSLEPQSDQFVVPPPPQGDIQTTGDYNWGSNIPQNTGSTTAGNGGNGGGLTSQFMDGLGTAANFAIPALQTYMGYKALKKAGDRPTDSLDPDYSASIDAARSNLNLAKANAKFGLSPEEQALLNQENQNLTNAQRFSARNFSGASAANAYGMEQSALNDSFARGLKTKILDREAMNQKQALAMNQQGYLDDMIAKKTEMSRRLFNDKLQGWQQDSSAGSALIGAGLSNAVGAGRYSAEKEAYDRINKKYNTNG